MTTQLKLRRGTTAQHASFTGGEGEVTVDTTKDTIVVHDGTTAGGIPLATEALANEKLAKSNNLSDLTNTTTARTNLGLGSLAVKNTVTVGDVSATGTPSSSTYLSGDGVWSPITIPASNNSQVFTSSGTFNVPAGVSRVKVTVVAAGGNGGTGVVSCSGGNGGSGGGGGVIVSYVGVTAGGTATVTVGTNAGTRTSSFAGTSTITATGGGNGGNGTSTTDGAIGTNGTSTTFGLNFVKISASRNSDTAITIGGSFETGLRAQYPFGVAGGSRSGSAGSTSRHTALGYGAGGGPGTGSPGATGSGLGTNGIVIVEW
jgi:hypothetical protein